VSHCGYGRQGTGNQDHLQRFHSVFSGIYDHAP
jgi:hypothetical protein